MIEPPLSPDEPQRLHALRSTGLLDTGLDARFERITRLAQRLLGTPIAAVSLVDANRQWFKSIQGLDVAETSRDVAFCSHTILQDDVMVVNDARTDERFHDNPLVTGSPNIVFYAGCPIRSTDGHHVASICVIDQKTREFTSADSQILRDLAYIVEREIRDITACAPDEQRDIAKRKNQVDLVTRTWNREAIFNLLDKQILRARQDGNGAAIILVEPNNISGIIRKYGISIGDEVLRQLAKRTLMALRDVDSLGRLNETTFAIAPGPCNGLAGIGCVADRIQKRVSENPIVTDKGVLKVELSFGITFCTSPELLTTADLIRAAESLVKSAKIKGGNCVESDWYELIAA